MQPHAERRRRLAEHIGDGIAVIPAGRESVRNDDVHHEFRQDSDFQYLTGFEEPDAVAILDPGHDAAPYVLLVRPRDREMEVWNGYRAGVEGARDDYDADAAHPIDELDAVLRDRLVGRRRLFYSWGGPIDGTVQGVLAGLRGLAERYGRTVPVAVEDPRPLLEEMRLRKSPAEAELLRAAARISGEGHLAAMAFAAPGVYEYQVQAVMEHRFRMAGSPRNGYPSIVASGPNACVLHYQQNTRRTISGDLLLIDAAAEYGYYSADITRTFPVDGTFTTPQRAVYEVVLAAQVAAIAAAKPGAQHGDVHDAAVRTIASGLVDLGLVPRGIDDTLAMHHYREFFMHGTGHWLGMDVHDAGSVRVAGESRVLEPGMAFTVEPGLYVSADRPSVDFALVEYDLDEMLERRYRIGWDAARRLEAGEREEAPRVTWEIPAEFRGIGVRIEDDLLLGEEDAENLTSFVPKAIEDVEAACAG